MKRYRKKRSEGILPYSKLDCDLWDRELADFVPQKIFDAHVHLWNDDFATPQTPSDNDWRDNNTDMNGLQSLSSILFRGRETHFLAFGLPIKKIDYEKLNSWVASELMKDPESCGALLLTPEISGEYIDSMICRHKCFIALKPYYTFASRQNPFIADYLPEEQMEAANEHALAIVLHLPDNSEQNLKDLEFYTVKYPRIQWILAHCAASFRNEQLEKNIRRLSEISNIWYDTALITECSTLITLLKYENRKRVMFGTDNAIGIGGCRPSLSSTQTTFRCYEQLIALRQAFEELGLPISETADIFYNNAHRLRMKIKSCVRRKRR